MDRTWSRIVAIWLLGVLAAAQFAKLSTLAPLLRATFDLSLPQVGLLISLLEIGGALFGFVAGLTLGRVGIRRFLLAGLGMLAATSVVEALAPNAAFLFGARAIEGFGYLLVVVAAPTLIVATAGELDRPRALALWSTFVPVGVGLGSAITGVANELAGPRATMLLWAAACATALVATARLASSGARVRRVVLPAPRVWLATFAFGLYTSFVCALTMLLPTFLIEYRDATISTASLLAGFASFAALPGSMIALWAMRRSGAPHRQMLVLACPTLLAAALLAPFIFLGSGRGIAGQAVSSAIAVTVVILSGIARTLLFTRLPVLAGAGAPDDPRIAAANGLLTQFGAGGALIGPPLGGVIVGRWGWSGLGVAVGLLALAMLATLTLAERARPRDARGT